MHGRRWKRSDGNFLSRRRQVGPNTKESPANFRVMWPPRGIDDRCTRGLVTESRSPWNVARAAICPVRLRRMIQRNLDREWWSPRVATVCLLCYDSRRCASLAFDRLNKGLPGSWTAGGFLRTPTMNVLGRVSIDFHFSREDLWIEGKLMNSEFDDTREEYCSTDFVNERLRVYERSVIDV